MNRLDGKIALISGAGRGIGAATAKLMIEAGAKVIIGDIIEKEGQELSEKLGPNASFVRLDVTMEEDWERAVTLAQSSFGGLDILANNAGLFLGRDFSDVSLDDWNRLASVNMTGVWLGTKIAADALAERGASSPQGSAIINTASIAGLVGSEIYSKNELHLTKEGHFENYKNLEPTIQTLLAKDDICNWNGYAGVRAATPDRLPCVGSVVDPKVFREDFDRLRHGPQGRFPEAPTYQPKLFVATGLGSRGFLTAELSSDILVSQMLGEPWPVERSIALSLSPSRFLYRELRLHK